MINHELSEYVKRGCPRHGQKLITRLCISKGCGISAPMCEDCFTDHDHDESISVRMQELVPLADFQESKSQVRVRKNVLIALKEFRSFSMSLQQAFDIMLSDTFAAGEEIYERYARKSPSDASINDLMKCTGEELGKTFEWYTNCQQPVSSKEVPKSLIYDLLEYKVVFKQLLSRLKDLADIVSLFDAIRTKTEKQSFDGKGFMAQMTNKFEKHFNFTPDKSNKQYDQKVEELKRLNSQKQHVEAIERAKVLIEQYPLLPIAYFERAFAEFEKGDFKRSFVSYSISNELGGPPHITHTNKGICLIRLGYLQRGIECCDKAIEKNQRYANAYCHKGIAYQTMKRYDEALACYEKTLRIKPDFKSAEELAKNLRVKMYRSENEQERRKEEKRLTQTVNQIMSAN